MRISLPTGIAFGVWYRWFAWRPIIIDGQIVWLETVERKLVGAQGYYEYFDYRTTTPTEATP